MDSIEAKQQQLKTSLQTLYTNSGLENFYKSVLDIGKTIIDQFTAMPKFLNLPINAIVDFGVKFANLANIVLTVASVIKQHYVQQGAQAQAQLTAITQLESQTRMKIEEIEAQQAILQKQNEITEWSRLEEQKTQITAAAARERQAISQGQGLSNAASTAATAGGGIKNLLTNNPKGASIGLSVAGLGLSAIGSFLKSKKQDGWGALFNIGGSTASFASMGAAVGGPMGMAVGAALGVVSGVINNWSVIFKSDAQKLVEAQAEAQEASNKALQARSDTKSLQATIDELKKLEAARYDSLEAEEAYYEATEKLAQTYPNLINGMDEAGNVTLDLDAAEQQLTASRQEAIKAAQTAAVANYKAAKQAESNVIDKHASTNRIQILGATGNIGTSLFNLFSTRDEELSKQELTFKQQAKELLAIDEDANLPDITEVLRQIAARNDGLTELFDIIQDGDEQFAINATKWFDTHKNNTYNDVQEQFFYDYFQSLFSDNVITANVSEVRGRQAATNVAIKSGVVSVIGLALQDYSDSVLSGMSGINEIIENQIYQAALSQDFSDEKAFNTFLAEQQAILPDLIDSYQTIWNTLDDKTQEQINNLIKSASVYSTDQFFETLNAIFQNDELTQAVQDYAYQSQYSVDMAKERIANLANTTLLVSDNLIALFDELGSTELQATSTYYANLINLIKNNKLSQGQGQSILDAYVALWEALPDEAAQREPAQKLLTAWDGSLSGLNMIINSFEQSGILTDDLQTAIDTLKNIIPKNLNTELSTLQTSFTIDLDNLTDMLSKAGKGLEYKDAIALANNLGITLQDLSYNATDGLYYYYDAATLANKYFNNINLQIQDVNSIIEALKAFAEMQTRAPVSLKNLNLENASAIIDQWATSFGLDASTLTTIIQEYQASTEEDLMTFIQSRYIGIYEGIQQELTNQQVRFYLNHGLINDFLTKLGITTATEEQISQLAQGTVPEDLQEQLSGWQQAIFDAYHNRTTQTYDALFDAINASASTIKVTDANRQALTNILGKDAIKDGYADLTGITADALWDSVLANAENFTNDELADQFLKYQKTITKSVKPRKVLTDLATSYEDISDDIIHDLIAAFGTQIFDQLKLVYDEVLGKWQIDDVTALQAFISTQLGADLQTANEILAQLSEHQYKLSATGILSDIINNYDALSETQVASLATLLGRNIEEVRQLLVDNDNGTYKLGISQLHGYIAQFGLESNQAIQSMLTDMFDNVLAGITGLAGNQTSGFTKLSDIQKYVNSINEQLVTNYQNQDLFEYVDNLHAFTFTTRGLIEYVHSLSAQLVTLSQDEQFVVSKLIADAGKQLANNIDIISFVEATTSTQRTTAESNLRRSVENYNAYVKAVGTGTQLLVDELIAALSVGGVDAVNAAQQVAQLQGTKLSTEQVATLYTQKSTQLLNAFEQLGYSLGSIVNETTARVLADNDYGLQELGNTGSYVVQTAGNLVEAYRDIYRELLISGTATLADLNTVSAKLYTTQSDFNVIDALNNAASMSYETLANVFTTQGKLMTDAALKTMQRTNLISDIGGGNLRINDFESFAKAMGFKDTDSEAYLSAFKTYNDSLIELNRKTEKQIVNEITSLTSAKVGDKINLTYLYSKLSGEDGVLGQLNTVLNQYGANFESGILDIQSQGNLIGVIQTISVYAQEYGGLLEEEVAQLADALSNILTTFTNTIANGIKGTLNNADANELKVTAKNMLGIDLSFTETVDGLKLSNQQAIQLYNGLSKINNISATKVFNSIKESLTSAGEACENISTTMANIARLESEAAKNSSGLTEEKKQQLALYKQIANVQLQDANQYDFMGRSLPDVFQGPVNYWDSIGDMFSTITAASNGYMGVQDYYNIVNELSNMATMSGPIEFMGMQIDGSLETAANLIERGFSALSNVDGEGVQIDLSKLGANFAGGAAAMGDDVEDGIHAMAKSQIEMLDGMIKLLETVVAMEQLGDIDVDSSKTIDFKEMFINISDNSYVATEEARVAAQRIINLAQTNTDLAAGLDDVRINGQTVRDMLQQLANSTQLTLDQANVTQTALNALYQMMLSGDYDLENLYQSIIQVANQSKLIGEIQIGDRTIAVGYGVTLEPNEDGHYNIAGKDYSSAERALEAFSLTQFLNTSTARGFTVDLEGEKPIVINEELGFEIYYNDNQEMQFRYNNQSFSSFDEMVAYAWDTYYSSELARNGQVIVPEDLAATEAEFKAQFYGTITYTESHVEIDQNSLEQISHAEYVAAQKALLSGSYDDENLQKIVKIDTVLADGQVDISQSDWEKATQALGIESIAVQLTTGDIEPSIQAILDLITSENKTVTLQLDFSGSETATAFLDKLSEIEEDNLNEIADTLARMASAANALSSVSWDSVVNGVNTLSAPDQGQTGTTIGAAIAFQDERTRELVETGTLDSEVNIVINESMIQSILDAMNLQVNVTPVLANVPTTTTSTNTNTTNTSTTNAASAVKINPIDSAVVESMNSAAEAISAAGAAMTDVSSKLSNAANAVEELGIKAVTMGSQVSTAGGRVQSASNAIAGGANVASNRLYTVRDALNGIPVMKQLTLQLRVTTTGAVSLMGSPTRNVTLTRATGNVALAAGTTKKTLVGELGPELMVTNGRYFLVGQNGAEMVDMPEDAIVFNHIQTEKLLKNGHSGRGNAMHGERKAIAMATGNAEGPAMASASAALSQLKQIRAMWQSLLTASLKDMGQMGGSGSGGGGGGGDSGIDPGFLADLERWYTLTQQIARLEKEINYEEKLRSKLSSDLNKQGEEYYASQVRSLENLNAQVKKQRELASLQKSYYEARMKDLENSPFGQIYHMENGVLIYNDAPMEGTDQRGGLFALTELFRQWESGQTVYNAKQQYNLLQEWGFGDYLLYDDQGKEIDLSEDSGYTDAVEAFWNKAQAYVDELDSLYDSYTDTLQDIVDNEIAINEIIQEMVDNQLDLENKILNAIIEREQAVIDELKDTRDAIDDAQTAFIEGLQDQLDKEKQMYDNQETEEETNRLRRQLVILQRSGGSAASISNLQKQIQQAEQDAYFDAQQQQIDAIQEASNKEIERLDTQIDLMTETLAYQKEHGLLWSEVYQVMALTKDEISNFITINSKDWESYSALYKQTQMQDLEFSIEQYKARVSDIIAANAGIEGKIDWVGQELRDTLVSASQNIETKIIEHNTDNNEGYTKNSSVPTTTTSNGGGGGGGSSGGSGGGTVAGASTAAKTGTVYVTYTDIYGNTLERPDTVTKTPGTYSSSTFETKRVSGYTVVPANTKVTVVAGKQTTFTVLYKKNTTTTTAKTTLTSGAKVAPAQKTFGFSSGGLVNYTGPAIVHGTKRKPEAFLDAATTKMWKEDILSNKNTSLTSTLLQMNEMLSNAASNSLITNNNNNGMSIDKVEVNMNVASIANDYDARRAGEQAMNEMVRIARKTGAQSLRR